MLIEWVAPDSGGSPILGYTVKIKKQDGTYAEDLVNCEMALDVATSCSVPVQVLVDTFGLEWGSSVYANVIATNVYGDSTQSADGNGAVIVTTPGTPTGLDEV